MCKFYISASLKRELFISRDRRDDSLLFKVVSKRGVRQFYCPTSNLEIFPREISSLGSKIREFNLSSRKRNRCTRVFFFFIIYVSILTAEIFRGIFYMSEGWKRIEDSWKGISKVENSRVLLVAFLFYAWKHRRAPRMTSFASSWKPSTTREENRKVFANFPYFPSINNFLSDSKNHL